MKGVFTGAPSFCQNWQEMLQKWHQSIINLIISANSVFHPGKDSYGK